MAGVALRAGVQILNYLGGALVFVAPISGVELCSRDRVLRTILDLHKNRAYA